MTKNVNAIESFELTPGRKLIGKYEVVTLLGQGWEGEVYLIKELATGIERAAKFFFPHRNTKNDKIKWYAKKLHKLRACPILIQYLTQENAQWRGHQIPFLVSEYVEGMLLSDFLKTRPGKRLTPFEALSLLHSLASGFQSIHQHGEYHGDLHSENVIITRYGAGFDVKVLDLFHWKTPKYQNIQDDLYDLIAVFHESLGGRKHYSKQPPEVKAICCGLKKTLIKKKFKTVGNLRGYLEGVSLT